ncbi:MAG: hypothetical protein K6U80_01065 [Firmicutes bacterium]|nr:hypothetical protein [Bacillota bacterium]
MPACARARGRQAVNLQQTRIRRKKVRLFNLIRLCGGILLVFCLIEAGRWLMGSLILRPYAAKWGTIEKGFWTDALFLREETLITAPVSGKLRIIVKSGNRVPRGELVAEALPWGEASGERAAKEEFNSQAQDPSPNIPGVGSNQPYKRPVEALSPFLIYSPEPGYLFFQYDGWEERFSLHNNPQLGKADFEREYRLQSAGNLVQAGAVIGKIINPFQQWVAIQVTSKETGIPKAGASWWMKTPEGLNPILYRKRISLSNNANQQILIFEDRGLNLDSASRSGKIYVIYRRVEGIIIPKHALFNGSWDKSEGARSYYVKVMKGGELKPQKVQVLDADGSNVIVEGLEFGTVIITR